MLNGDAHRSGVEGELSLRIRPVALVFKDKDSVGYMITEDAPAAQPSSARHRILYVGRDITLAERLNDALLDCHVVRCPGGSTAQLFIRGDSKYSLFIFDEEQAEELESLALSLKHRARTPTLRIRKSEDFHKLVYIVRRL